ncbi:MAG: radical SAM protein [Patescibacteria group bacterium]
MRVLFIIPRAKNLFGDDPKKGAVASHPHVGIAYLIAFIKRQGHESYIFDETVEGWDEEILNSFLEKNKFDLVAITSFSYCFKFVLEIIDRVKKKVSCPILIGGPHVSAARAKVMEEFTVDFAIKGEGELTLSELLIALAGDAKDFSGIDGLIWKDQGRIIENKDRELIQDLDSIPFPDYEAFKLEKYFYTEAKTLPIITSRGCPYGCNYCSVRLSMGRGFRPRSPENVVSELEHWISKGFVNYEFNDDCFSLDLDRAERICDLIIEKGLKITWQLYNGIRVDRVSKILLEKMKASGCVFIAYGCESGNQKIIDNMGKAIKLEQVKEAVRLTNEVGIKNSVNFIIGHPGETWATAMETLKFAKTLPTGFVNMYNLIPYPGTELYRWINEHGTWLYSMDYILAEIGSRDLKPAFETKEFPKEQRIKILKKAFSLYEYRILIFRLGKLKGKIVYYLTRFEFLMKFGRQFALENKFGNKIYRLLSHQSRIQDGRKPASNAKNKIIIVNHNCREKGTYFRCLGFAKELAKRGHAVEFFCLRAQPKLWLKKHREVGIDFIEMPWLAPDGFGALVEHFFRGLYIFLFVLFTPKVKVVHSFNVASPMVGFSTFLIFLIKKAKKIKLVVDWDDWWGTGGLLTLNKKGRLQELAADFLETKIPLLADQVTLHNDLIKQRALAVGVKMENITKIYNGADVDAYQELYDQDYNKAKARQELGLPQDKNILFFGGAVVESASFVIDVVKLMNNDKILLIIVGPVAESVIARAQSLPTSVVFRKWLPYDDFKKYLFASDILLLPRSDNSLLDRCTFPGRVGDYLMAGRPIVASDVGELSKVFREDKIGLLAKSDDLEDFKNKIIDFMEDEAKREEFGATALKTGLEKYNWENLTSVLLSRVYQREK